MKQPELPTSCPFSTLIDLNKALIDFLLLPNTRGKKVTRKRQIENRVFLVHSQSLFFRHQKRWFPKHKEH